jgi:hypothetical protein
MLLRMRVFPYDLKLDYQWQGSQGRRLDHTIAWQQVAECGETCPTVPL